MYIESQKTLKYNVVATGCPSAKADVLIGPDREKYSVPRQSSELFMVLNSGNFCQMIFF